MCPGRMPLPTAPGPTKDFLQRLNGSTPAGVALKTGTIFSYNATDYKICECACGSVIVFIQYVPCQLSDILHLHVDFTPGETS